MDESAPHTNFFFFFQAEDGIRDVAVTGVQTCALPISTSSRLFATLDPTVRSLALPSRRPALLSDTVGFIRKLPSHLVAAFHATLEELEGRSEERRVGKEGRWGCGPEHDEAKDDTARER